MDARAHATRWLASWNAHDLDQIMACYADNVDFVAPTVVTRWARPHGRLNGKTELREHFSRGLRLAPDLTFTEEAFLALTNRLRPSLPAQQRQPGPRRRRDRPTRTRSPGPRLLRTNATSPDRSIDRI